MELTKNLTQAKLFKSLVVIVLGSIALTISAKINDNFFIVLFKLIIATSTIYILGLIWLGTLIGWDKPIFALGAKPFLLAEIFKIMLLALLTKQIIKIKKFI